MAQKTQKKETLPVKVDVDLQNGGTISYANEVIATIAGVAANEIDGIAGMCVSGGFSEILGRNRNITRGVKVEVGSQEAAVDLYIIVEYGKPIQKVAAEVQENVRKALESLTGLHVVRVDVHVQGVSFEKEKKANQNILEASKSPVLTAPPVQEPEVKKEPEPAAPPKAPEQPKEEEPAPEQPKAEEAASEEKAQEPEETEFSPDTLLEEAALDCDPQAEPVEAAEEAPADNEASAEPQEAPQAEAAPEAKPASRRKKKTSEDQAAEGGEEKPARRPKGRLRA